jgi:hypothetical protein
MAVVAAIVLTKSHSQKLLRQLSIFVEMVTYVETKVFLLNILSLVLVTNNARSGLDERVYLLLIHSTSNYT